MFLLRGPRVGCPHVCVRVRVRVRACLIKIYILVVKKLPFIRLVRGEEVGYNWRQHHFLYSTTPFMVYIPVSSPL